MVLELTDATFEEEINNSELPVLVEFWGPACGPCQTLSPLIALLAEKTDGYAKICKVNTHEHPAAAAEFNVRGLPTVIVFEQGEEAARFMGVQHPEKYLDALGLEVE